MTKRFLSAAFSRRALPKGYDAGFLNTELARLSNAMPTYIVRRITANSALQVNDGMVLVDCTAGPVILTLGNPATASGRPITIKKSDSSANPVILAGMIDGTLNRSLQYQNDSSIIQSDGTMWFRPMTTAAGVIFTGTFTSLSVVSDATPNINYLEFTQEFNTSAWVPGTGVTVTGNTATAPDGTMTADTLAAVAVVGNNLSQSPWTVTSNGRITISIYIKRLTTTSQTNFGAYDITAGTTILEGAALWTGDTITSVTGAGGSTGGVYTFSDAGSGWYRVSGYSNAPFVTTNTYSFFVYARNGGNAGSIYVWGAQVQLGVLTAYRPNVAVSTVVSITGKTAILGDMAIIGNTTLTGAFTASGAIAGTSATDATSTSTGAVKTAGGIGIIKALWVGGLANIAGAVTFQSSAKSTSASAGIGYGTGAGGIITQATSKATAFTLSKVTGRITTAGDTLAAATSVTATWTNTAFAVGDTVTINHASGGTIGSYVFNVACGAGTGTLTIRNIDVLALTETLVLQFTLQKGVNA